MNIYLHELKASRKFIFTWLLSKLSLAAIMILMYTSISSEIDVFKQVLSNFPESMRIAFGISIEKLDTPLGYYSSYVLTIILVCSAIEAMIFGMSILSKELREKTADFLYTKPISRYTIITSKLLSSLTLLIVSNIIFILGLYISLSSVATTSFDFTTFILLALMPFLIQLIFFSIGILVSAMLSKLKAVLPISMGIVFGLYVLSSFADDKLRMLMPFKYFDNIYVLDNSKYELKYVILTFLVIIISTALTFLIYKKKDIQAI